MSEFIRIHGYLSILSAVSTLEETTSALPGNLGAEVKSKAKKLVEEDLVPVLEIEVIDEERGLFKLRMFSEQSIHTELAVFGDDE